VRLNRRCITAAAVLAAACRAGRDLAPVRLEPIVTLGTDSGNGAITTSPRVSPLHPRGFRIVIPAASGVTTVPSVFAGNGQYLGSLRGGSDASQQFQSPLFARFGPGDSIWVFDGSGRALIFDPDRRFVRVVPLPTSPWDALVLSDSRIVIAPANADRPLPLLLLAANGEVVREIGGTDSAGAAIRATRWIVGARGGTFWSMPTQFQWRLEQWDTSGTSLKVTGRTPAWFPEYARLTPPSRDHAPQPAVQGAWLDVSGRLWVLGVVADAHWSAGLSSGRAGQGADVILDPDNAFDAVLEAFDLATGRVIATARVDAFYSAAVEAGVIMRIREQAGGSKRLELVRVVFDSTRAANQEGRR
jgi:hypothetical protein